MFFFFTRWGWLWGAQPIIVLEQNTPSYTTASGSATLLVRVPVVRGRVQVHLKAKRLRSLDLPLVFIIQVRKMCELYILVSFVRCVSLLLMWYLPCFSQNQRRQGLQILGMFLTRLPVLSILLNIYVSTLVHSFVFFLQEQPRSSFWSLWYYYAITVSGDALIANFCVNIAFFECHTQFSHIAASPYAKWQHRLNKLWLTGVRRISQH